MPYLLRRLLGALAVLMVASVVVFGLLQLAPGDPAAVVAGPDATDADVAAARHELGLDKPLVVQYVTWLGGFVTGDLGNSLVLGRPILDLILQRLDSTVQLLLVATILMIAISVVLGVVLASERWRAVRNGADFATTVALAVPPFVSSIILIFVFAVVFPILPSGGDAGFFDSPDAALRHILLPAIALALPNAAVLARLLETDIRRARQEEFVLTAAAKGVPNSRITWGHVVPFSLGPYVIQLGVTVGELLGGALVVEAIFARAGIGGLLIDAVTTRDYQLAQAVLLLTVAAAIVAQFLSELGISRIDPRVKLDGSR